jgi:hypothetical protein
MEEDEWIRMLTFAPIRLADYALFQQHLGINRFLNSEYNFTTLFAWQAAYQMEYALVEGCLCVKARGAEGEYFYYPLGERDRVEAALGVLLDHARQKNIPLVLMSLSESMLECLREFPLTRRFTPEPRPALFDYIYPREQLAGLKGKKMDGKRNHFNFFIKNYDWALTDITPDNLPECRAKLREFILARSENPEEELSATNTALEHRAALNLVCKCLYADGQLAGVIMAENHHGTALIQIAKSDVTFRGASVALFRLFLEENFTGCASVNFMEDMGLPGLRNAKMSYHPDHFIEKSVLTVQV